MLKIDLSPSDKYVEFGQPVSATWIIENPYENVEQILHSFACALRTIGFTDNQIETYLGDY